MPSSGLSFAPPEALAAAERVVKPFLEAGAAAWATMTGCDVSIEPGDAAAAKPAEWAQGFDECVLTEIAWSGDHSGRLFFAVEAMGAKAVVAHMMALMMGATADPAATLLDAEGMDAYSEAVNSLAGQGAQALRGELGGTIKLAVSGTKKVNFADPASVSAMGDAELLGASGRLTCGKEAPARVLLLFEPSCVGQRWSAKSEVAPAPTVMPVGESFPEDNMAHALELKVPLVVVLAVRRMRMELIQEMSPGTIIEFRKQSGEPLDVFANNVRIARAEVVTTNQHFGVQIQKIIDPREEGAT